MILAFSGFSSIQLLLFGAVAPAAIIAAAPADARPIRVDIPVRIDPKSSVYVLWVKVQAEGESTLVSGYVRQKRWFARNRGDLHIAFLRHDQQVACLESNWKKYRFPSRGQWRFAASANVPASRIDSVQISHVIHDQKSDPAPDQVNSCSMPATNTTPSSGA
ncbi:hypothetical protein [Sphingobium fuliginis]|uniref:DUF2914 domain-containing protein n=1 Tax=Sphingobium fuliginis ATCC 27551 TaxID=1208342 RepID=A0A5B8CNK4_SPHSA|nr:hypothetical protein [Sphingobium fuliginis]QDC40252.1 hypothetical protein FIL70_24180 [Sphingobium fuliginis ATCC 27551]